MSVIVITLNEAANIEACLESVKWADEIIVIDSGSSDDTCALARKYTDRVVSHPWEGYSEQKNYGHSLARGDYVLSIDADERVSPPLQSELQVMLTREAGALMSAYRIPICDWMFGKLIRHGSWPHQAPVRLYRKGALCWQGTVHEATVVEGQVGRLCHPLYHFSHTSIGSFLEKLNRYTDLEAEEMFQKGRRASLPLALAGAARAFGGQYIRLQGFRDGGHGLILALLMAIYYFVLRAKLWSLWYMHEHADRA
ncbi:MAG: glycosyltransferase family 2 protein [Chloroflexi bacterium]|nr:glycosyltransferase family 2 protein [Chloroflexota bacterium]